MKPKKILTVLTMFVLATAVMGTTHHAYAQEKSTKQSTFFQGLIDFVSEKFKLNKTEVQTAIEQYKEQNKAAMTADMQKRDEERLAKLVTEGKITEDQKKAIIAELITLRAKYSPDASKDMTKDQRKTQMEAMQTELKVWAESQNIDRSYVIMQGRGGHGMRQGMPTS